MNKNNMIAIAGLIPFNLGVGPELLLSRRYIFVELEIIF